jgi:ribosomal protein S6
MDEEKDKKTYELALLLSSEDEIARVIDLVREYRGEAVAEPRAKKLALAYTIKGKDEAVFVSYFFQALGDDVKNLERDLRTRQEVIRSMIMIAPPQSERQERQSAASPAFPSQRRGRPSAERPAWTGEQKPSAPQPLSNEALEKKIEEISQ